MMLLRLRLINLERRGIISECLEDVQKTLAILRALAGSDGEWREASPTQSPLPIDGTGLARLFTQRRVRNNVGYVMEDMGYSVAAFLDAPPPKDVYVSFHIGVQSPHTEEGITCHIPSEIVDKNWEGLIGAFCELVVRWSPEFADIMNLESLDVICEELAGRVPVGFACYGARVPLIEPPEFAKAREVGDGSILYLTCPTFDVSREEGARLRAIADLFLVAAEQYRGKQKKRGN